jgi:chromosome segregation ATPase
MEPLQSEIDRLNREQESIRAVVNSMIKSAHDNLVHIMEGQASARSWQESHEKLDAERWQNLQRQLGEVKGLLETVPIKVGEDMTTMEKKIGLLHEKLEQHDKSISFLRGAWFALTAAGAVLAFLFGALKAVH